MSEDDGVVIGGNTLHEDDIRQWFTHVGLEQAIDTHRAVMVIIETRMALKPKRARRKDAGVKRQTQSERIQEEIERDAEQPDLGL